MSLNVIRQFIKDRWVSASTFCVSIFLYSWLIVSIMPIFLGKPEFQNIFKVYPRALLNILTGTSGANFLTPEGFISLEFFGLWWVVIVVGFIIAAATAIVSREIEEGTMDVLLSQPLTRTALLTSRFLALLVYLLVLTAVSVLGVWVLALYYNVDLSLRGLAATGVMGLAFFVAISSYTLLFSLVLRERSTAIVASVFLFVGSYLLNALSPFSKSLDRFRFLSFYRYYHPENALATAKIPLNHLSVFIIFSIVCFALSLIIFRRKDIRAA